jgi:hypothetical protein
VALKSILQKLPDVKQVKESKNGKDTNGSSGGMLSGYPNRTVLKIEVDGDADPTIPEESDAGYDPDK